MRLLASSARRRRSSPDGLLREWHRRALSGPWRVASDWLCPEAMALVRAAHNIDTGRGTGIRAELRALGRARASQGVGAAESVADLFAFFDALGMPPSGPLTAAFTEAWAESAIDSAPHVSCVDPATALATWGHFRARLYEVYADSSAVPGTHIIAMLRLPTGTPALASAGWHLQDLIGRTVREAFTGLGAVISSVNASILILMPRHTRCFAALGECSEALDAALGSDGARCRIDLEPLPATIDGVDLVLDSLQR